MLSSVQLVPRPADKISRKRKWPWEVWKVVLVPGEATPCFFNPFGIFLGRADMCDSHHQIVILLVSVSPDISESSIRGCSLVNRLERGSNFVTSGGGPMHGARHIPQVFLDARMHCFLNSESTGRLSVICRQSLWIEGGVLRSSPFTKPSCSYLVRNSPCPISHNDRPLASCRQAVGTIERCGVRSLRVMSWRLRSALGCGTRKPYKRHKPRDRRGCLSRV